MKNCHNCKYFTGKKFMKYGSVCYKCNGPIEYISATEINEKCRHWKEKEQEKSCDTCLHENCSGNSEECEKCIERDDYFYWQPKQKEAVKMESKAIEKEYTIGQMVDLLLENPRNTACKDGDKYYQIEFVDKALVWKSDNQAFNYLIITQDLIKSKWQIREPKLKEVELWEAYLQYSNQFRTIKSVLSDEEYSIINDDLKGLHEATKEELKAKFIIIN